MKIFEFEQPDAQRDGRRLLDEMIMSRVINESASTQINNFVQAIEGYNIPQSDLVEGKYYCPLSFTHDAGSNKAVLIIVTAPAEYVREQGSRLLFKYKNTDQSLPFPADGYTTPNDVRVITANMTDLDKIIQQFSLQFSKEQWSTQVHGYNTRGQLQPVANL
jgi:hypothetical protein